MDYRTLLLCSALLGVGFSLPAAGQRGPDPWPVARPLGREIPAFKPTEGSVVPGTTAAAHRIETVTLGKALELALAQNPELAALGWEVRAMEGRIAQAGLLPNPELEGEIENLGGSAERRGFRSAEATVQVSQLIELGGKRGRRTRVAQGEREVAGWEYEAKRLDVYAETSKAFYDVLATQRQVDLRERQLGLAQRVFEAVRERVSGGRVSPLEETRARVEASTNRIALERARRELDAASDRLVAAWGGAPASFGKAEGDLERTAAPPPLGAIIEHISDNPDIQRALADIDRRRSVLRLEQARNIPDVKLSAGIRRFRETEDNAFVAGVSIPIPVFGLNRGAILEAERRLPQGQAQGRATLVDATAAASQAYRELSATYAEIGSLTTDVLPGAEEAYEGAQIGYQQGRFDLLNVLDAQRTLFEAHVRYVEALAAYHRVRAEVERLIGRPLAEVAAGAPVQRGQP